MKLVFGDGLLKIAANIACQNSIAVTDVIINL